MAKPHDRADHGGLRVGFYSNTCSTTSLITALVSCYPTCRT